MDERLRRSQQQERRGATVHGGRLTPGSGNTPHRKGDVRLALDQYTIEYKRTDAARIAVKEADWRKVFYESVVDGRMPVMGIEFGAKPWRLMVLDEQDFLALWEAAGGQRP